MAHHSDGGEGRGWKGWLWMAACCVPILAVIVLGYCSSRSP